MFLQPFWWMAALTTGVVGSLHCVGMCGPLAMALPVGRLPRRQWGLAIGLYHAGRVTAYAGLGLLVGTAGQGFLLAGLQRPLAISAGLFLLIWAIIRREKGAGLTMSRPARWVVQPMTRLLRNPALPAFAGFGFLNGLLPCGFVYVALVVATTMGNGTIGAIYMSLFGLGTVPALVVVRYLPNLFPVALRRRLSVVMPVLTIAMAALLLARGTLGAGFRGKTLTEDQTPIPVCHGSLEK